MRSPVKELEGGEEEEVDIKMWLRICFKTKRK